jgi:hypothetical protein
MAASSGSESASTLAVSDTDGSNELLDAIGELATEPSSVRRDVELAALLQRLATMDPAQAVELAQREYL